MKRKTVSLSLLILIVGLAVHGQSTVTITEADYQHGTQYRDQGNKTRVVLIKTKKVLVLVGLKNI